MLPLWSTLPEDGTPLPKQYMSTRNTQWLSRPTPVRYTPPPSRAIPKASTTKKPPGLSAAQKAANAAAAAAAAAASKAAAEKASRERKQNEATKTQVDALKKMIDTTFGQARDTKLGGVDTVYGQQDATLLSAFQARADKLGEHQDDNEAAEHDSTQSNLTNRARERGDIITQALSVGAGETDLLRTQMMAARNWAANQQDVNRSYYDTMRSINSNINELNQDTRVSRFNLANQANADRGQIWDSYYNQLTDTWNQIANLEGSNTNDSFTAQYKDAMDKAANAAGQAWKDPGVNASVRDWKGQAITENQLNNSMVWHASERGEEQTRRPEGASLRTW